MLGRCEQFFLELMKVPRVESKLNVFSFKITFSTQVKDLRSNLNIVNDVAREVKESVKLRQIMQTILTLGNALNQGTARGSAIGFKLDSLLKLSDTRAKNNKMTLMHYLCKLLAEKLPELLDFGKDLVHLEAASKIQLKTLAEEMQAVSKGLEKVEKELTASGGDGEISKGFQKVLKVFLDTAEAEVRSLISLYSEVARNADSLSQYFGEDPARCPFEQGQMAIFSCLVSFAVTSILLVFVNMFDRSREENAKLAEAEKMKLEKEAIKEKTYSSVKKDNLLLAQNFAIDQNVQSTDSATTSWLLLLLVVLAHHDYAICASCMAPTEPQLISLRWHLFLQSTSLLIVPCVPTHLHNRATFFRFFFLLSFPFSSSLLFSLPLPSPLLLSPSSSSLHLPDLPFRATLSISRHPSVQPLLPSLSLCSASIPSLYSSFLFLLSFLFFPISFFLSSSFFSQPSWRFGFDPLRLGEDFLC
ncbi:formin-like protein 14 isoform X1 [Cinnamomum micranthum f. kanehirae]|uniref:Formin-like protein n=1 Tax=Cinnamomum micranthum f. kanehirae TaxID=337451 RepID=A0A443PW46_9MAGN|nr:formin-like protein 14 isoform X1 [Cinnamomum micranthum f. kanehirae]